MKALFNQMQGISFLYIFDMEWTKEVPYPFGQQLRAFIPPLIIIGFNQLLLLLISYASIYYDNRALNKHPLIYLTGLLERHSLHSAFESSVLSKSFFYMLFNILIIPSLTSNNSGMMKKSFEFLNFIYFY